MEIEAAPVDAALTTTRAVRRRLDLGRDVDNQILLDCIDVAEQAPTGGNLGSRRWLIVRDPAVKADRARLYNQRTGPWRAASAERLAGTGHPQEKVMASAAFLAAHLTGVPALVIVTIIGRQDGSGRPGLFDSVIEAAWSFCVALRARGLGSSWVTAVFSDKARVRELPGIPADHTEIVMLPVAWTRSRGLRPAERIPARSITYFDAYGRTFEAGPQPLPRARLADGPGTIVKTDIKAPAATVWALVTDLSVLAAFSAEFLGAQWENEDRGAGATFLAVNHHPAVGKYQVRCWGDAREENRASGWRTRKTAPCYGVSASCAPTCAPPSRASRGVPGPPPRSGSRSPVTSRRQGWPNRIRQRSHEELRMVRYSQSPTARAQVHVSAPPGAVWLLVSDITVPVRFSAELVGAEWTGGAEGPCVGARFVGRSHHDATGDWQTTCVVVTCEKEKAFAWVVGDPAYPSGRWGFELEAEDGGTCLAQWAVLGPAPSGLTPAILAMPDKEERIVARRLHEHEANMRRCVEGIKALAEGELL